MATRRGFLSGLMALSAAPAVGWAGAGSPDFLACAREPDGAYALFGLSSTGEDRFRVTLPARGHAGAGHPSRPLAVVFARRPGAYALAVDCATGEVQDRIEPPPGRQFNGHGVFLDDGDLLATSEQLADSSEGRIGLWSVGAGWRRLGEIPTGGLGPHDLRRAGGGRLLVVANGGIATDPTDRRKLNLATMRSSLAYVDPDAGPVDQVELAPEFRQGSIRHLAVAADGTVAFAMQWEGDAVEAPPLVGFHRRGGVPRLASLPEVEGSAMRGYAGSIALDGGGTQVAISSPRGGRVQRFGLDGRFLGGIVREDVCGLAPLAAGFLASDGTGGLLALSGEDVRAMALRDRAWDNHIVAL